MQRIAIFAVLTLAALTAHGQIIKCTDRVQAGSHSPTARVPPDKVVWKWPHARHRKKSRPTGSVPTLPTSAVTASGPRSGNVQRIWPQRHLLRPPPSGSSLT